MQQIKAIAFDLDDTLIDTSRYLVPAAQKAAFLAMIEAGLPANLSQIEKLKEDYLKNSSADLFGFICDSFNLDESNRRKCIEAANDSFYKREIPAGLELFKGAEELLAGLKSRYALYLVTSGDPVTQLKKIAHLKMSESFLGHLCVDSLIGERKLHAFEKILEREKLSPSELLSVGNRIDNEIEEAKILGCQTCLVRHGEYAHLVPINPQQKPDYEIDHIIDLIAACHL